MTKKLYIGLMSGTSMDGIDAVLVDVDTNTLIAGMTKPYSDKVRQCLGDILNQEQIRPANLSQLNTLIGREFASAVQQLLAMKKVDPKSVLGIGSHGQTICHDATADIPYTIQLGCAHTIAELTGIKVVADFRTRDLVVGGQGAPFAPIYHQALFATQELSMAVVNIGGIANVTYLNQDSTVEGYDIGPGNCLMDTWINQHLNYAYDDSGAWAATGTVLTPLLSALLDDPYFNHLPPKSLGREYFSSSWLASKLQPNYAANDVQATLLAFTATTIAEDIKKRAIGPKHVAICGGGAHNMHLLQAMKKQLPDIHLDSTNAFGVDPNFLEAMMFAWLADKTLSHTALDMRGITGANNLAILGAIYAAGIDKGNSIDV